MTLDSNGKYCGACNKTVIDFTTWEVEEIKKYLLTKNENVCGHFRTLQVAVKRPKHHQFLVDLYLKTDTKFKTPYFKTLTLSLIVLCMTVVGCNRPTTDQVSTPDEIETKTTGEVAMPPIDTMTKKIDTASATGTLIGDTTVEVQRGKPIQLVSGTVCIKPERKK